MTSIAMRIGIFCLSMVSASLFSLLGLESLVTNLFITLFAFGGLQVHGELSLLARSVVWIFYAWAYFFNANKLLSKLEEKYGRSEVATDVFSRGWLDFLVEPTFIAFKSNNYFAMASSLFVGPPLQFFRLWEAKRARIPVKPIDIRKGTKYPSFFGFRPFTAPSEDEHASASPYWAFFFLWVVMFVYTFYQLIIKPIQTKFMDLYNRWSTAPTAQGGDKGSRQILVIFIGMAIGGLVATGRSFGLVLMWDRAFQLFQRIEGYILGRTNSGDQNAALEGWLSSYPGINSISNETRYKLLQAMKGGDGWGADMLVEHLKDRRVFGDKDVDLEKGAPVAYVLEHFEATRDVWATIFGGSSITRLTSDEVPRIVKALGDNNIAISAEQVLTVIDEFHYEQNPLYSFVRWTEENPYSSVDLANPTGRARAIYNEARRIAVENKVHFIAGLSLVFCVLILWFFQDPIVAVLNWIIENLFRAKDIVVGALVDGATATQAKLVSFTSSVSTKAAELKSSVASVSSSVKDSVKSRSDAIYDAGVALWEKAGIRRIRRLEESVLVPTVEGKKGKNKSGRGAMKTSVIRMKSGHKKRTVFLYDTEKNEWLEVPEDQKDYYMQYSRFVDGDTYRNFMISHADDLKLSEDDYRDLMEQDWSVNSWIDSHYSDSKHLEYEYDEDSHYHEADDLENDDEYFARHGYSGYESEGKKSELMDKFPLSSGGSSVPVAPKSVLATPPEKEGCVSILSEDVAVHVETANKEYFTSLQTPKTTVTFLTENIPVAHIPPPIEGKAAKVRLEKLKADEKVEDWWPVNWSKLDDEDKKACTKYVKAMRAGRKATATVPERPAQPAFSLKGKTFTNTQKKEKVKIEGVKAEPPKAEGVGAGPAVSPKWMDGIATFGSGKTLIHVPVVGKYILATSHIVNDLAALDYKFAWEPCGDHVVTTTAGAEKLYRAPKPSVPGLKSLPIAVYDPIKTSTTQCFLFGDGKQTVGNILGYNKDGFLVHTATTWVNWCNTPVVVDGKVVGLHIGTENDGKNVAFPITQQVMELMSKSESAPGKNSPAGGLHSDGGALTA